MKYETPELNALVAIDAVKTNFPSKRHRFHIDFVDPGNIIFGNEPTLGYTDWEE